MTTVTFDKTLTQLLRRSGLDMETSPDLTQYPDLEALLNLRLRECWEYAWWDFLMTVASETYTTETYRYIDISDGRDVVMVSEQDPREYDIRDGLRTSIVEGGKLRLQEDCPDTIYYQYRPAAPDWAADDPAPAVYECFRPAAVELAYADQLEEDGQHGKSQAVMARGYHLLNELSNRRAIMHTVPSISVRTGARTQGGFRTR